MAAASVEARRTRQPTVVPGSDLGAIDVGSVVTALLNVAALGACTARDCLLVVDVRVQEVFPGLDAENNAFPSQTAGVARRNPRAAVLSRLCAISHP